MVYLFKFDTDYEYNNKNWIAVNYDAKLEGKILIFGGHLTKIKKICKDCLWLEVCKSYREIGLKIAPNSCLIYLTTAEFILSFRNRFGYDRVRYGYGCVTTSEELLYPFLKYWYIFGNKHP